MLEKLLYSRLKSQQILALERAREAFKSFPTGRGVTAFFLVIVNLFASLFFDLPMHPSGQELDLTGYELVFEDEFEGDSLDLDKWQYRGTGPRRGGYNHPDQVRVEDGNMILRGEWHEDGEFGPGWYTGMVRIIEEFTFGYFEMKCIMNDAYGFFSAFWLQSANSYNPELSKGGTGGAEIDIFEAFDYHSNFLRKNSVRQTVYCAGTDGHTPREDGIDRFILGNFYGKNIFEEYNTYGLEWTEDEYIFYINGVETARTSFGNGTSKVPEYVIASLEPQDEINYEKDFKTDFIIDYVKVYQKQGS